jgi:hypothetical protein
MKSLPGTDSVWMREFEPALIRELEYLMKIVPHCGSNARVMGFIVALLKKWI